MCQSCLPVTEKKCRLLKKKFQFQKLSGFSESALSLLPKTDRMPLNLMQDPDTVFQVEHLLHHTFPTAYTKKIVMSLMKYYIAL